MPVGIQMFATISSKDHLRSLQEDLQMLHNARAYQDSTLHCGDGTLLLSRMLVGLIFPHLQGDWSFYLCSDPVLVLPNHTIQEVESLLLGLLGHQQQQQVYEESMMCEWSEAIDTIIDNLKPEKMKNAAKKRSAVLHSSLTKETAVIHAAGAEEEKDYAEPVLVVNESADPTEEPHTSAVEAPAQPRLLLSAPPLLRIPGGSLVPVLHQPTPSAPSPVPPHGQASHQIQPPPTPAHLQHPPLAHQQQPAVLRQPIAVLHPSVVQQQPQQLVHQQPQQLVLQFPCPTCQMVFPAQDQLEVHTRLHSQRNKCATCGETFAKARDLAEHQRIHSGQKMARCHVCEKDFTEKGLKLHIERFHKLEPAQLQAPKLVPAAAEEEIEAANTRTQEAESTRRGDEEVEQEAKSHTSPTRKERRKRPTNIVFSSSSESDPDEPDPVVTARTTAATTTTAIIATKSKPTRPTASTANTSKTEHCQPCDRYFTKKGIKIHRQRHHRGEKTKRSASDNEVEEEEEEEWGREDTESTSKIKKNLSKRLSRSSRKNPPLKKLFSCAYCHKRFSHLASMKVHEKVHLGGKPHQCDMCAAKFSNKFDLFAHEERTHSAARPHKCDECAATFKTADSLRFHKLIHEESQPLVCRYCQRAFKNKGQLDFHERVHLGEKPFKCDRCEQGFETATKLTRHITVSHMQD